MYYANNYGRDDRRRKSVSMAASLALHMLLFIILHLAGMGIGRTEIKGEFDLEAIKVVNMIAAAKDSITTKPKNTQQKKTRPKAFRKSRAPKARVKSVAKNKPVVKPLQKKTDIKQAVIPKHEVERVLERKVQSADLVIPKDTEITIDKKLFEEPKRIAKLEKIDLEKQFKPHRKIKRFKRQIKAIDTPAPVKEMTEDQEPEVDVATISKHTPRIENIREKPVIRETELPKVQETKRIIDRQQEVVAKLIVDKDPTAASKMVFTDKPQKQINVKATAPVKKIRSETDIRHQKRRRINTAALSTYSSKAPRKATKKNAPTLSAMVKKKVNVPTSAPRIKKLPDIPVVPEDSSPMQERKAQEKQLVAQSNLDTPQKKRIYSKKIATTQEPAKAQKKVPLTTHTPTIEHMKPQKKLPSLSKQDNTPTITVDMPSEQKTSDPLYKVTGTVDADVRSAFLTVNDVTQVLTVVNGKFEADIAMVKGLNKVEILVFSSRGGIGKNTFNLLFSPLSGAPTITLEYPENGRQGMREGDEVLVMGSVDDVNVQEAVLLLNGIPLPPMQVFNGVFKRKIFLPNTRITTFRVMAKSRKGVTGYSAIHTVLSGYDIDLNNPRPY